MNAKNTITYDELGRLFFNGMELPHGLTLEQAVEYVARLYAPSYVLINDRPKCFKTLLKRISKRRQKYWIGSNWKLWGGAMNISIGVMGTCTSRNEPGHKFNVILHNAVEIQCKSTEHIRINEIVEIVGEYRSSTEHYYIVKPVSVALQEYGTKHDVVIKDLNAVKKELDWIITKSGFELGYCMSPATTDSLWHSASGAKMHLTRAIESLKRS